MEAEVEQVLERLATHLTDIRTRSRVGSHVTIQCTVLAELPPAHLALVPGHVNNHSLTTFFQDNLGKTVPEG